MNKFEMIGELINVLGSFAIIPLTFMLSIIFVYRKIGKKQSPDSRINRWNKKLRKKHISLGITLVIVAGFHTVWASMKHGWYLSWGKVAFVVMIFLLLSYLLRKKLKGKWIVIHRILTVIFIVSIVMHLASIPSKQGGIPTQNNFNVQERMPLGTAVK